MDTMTALAHELPHLHISLEQEDYERLTVTPWFSFRVAMPCQPLPSLEERPVLHTERLTIRPIASTDLEAFHALRSCRETQVHSPSRGRVDRDVEESRQNIEWMHTNFEDHWWFGAFLSSTGDLIGEGGLPDCNNMPRSGWPEAEILLKPAFRRQGLGTEMWRAVAGSWWQLPREMRRHQLLPLMVPDKDPGDEVIEGLGYVWEEDNLAARAFFAKVLKQKPVSATGSFVDFDRREGRDLELVRWSGTLEASPLART